MPAIAAEFGLRVTVGAWIDKDQDRNEREIRSVIDLASRHSNVNGIIVGNETIYRGELKVAELIKLIQRVKRRATCRSPPAKSGTSGSSIPSWCRRSIIIAAHILPYWEGFSDKQAVDQAIVIYDKLRQAYPGKRIVIAEFGWPSAGYNFKDANPGRIEQAVVLRDFVSRAEAYGIDYNIVEAIDQPWKIIRRRRRSLLGSVRRRRASRNSTGPARSAIPITGKLAGIALLVERAAVAADPGDERRDAVRRR